MLFRSTTFYNFPQLSTTITTFPQHFRYCTCFNRQPADDNLIDEDESSDNEASEISTDLEDYEWDFPLNEDISNDNGFM